jgi:hypothetical protein
MALLKKTLFDESIEKYNVFINDTAPFSEYFKITELPDTFTGGKNAFLIQGSPELVADSIIKIQIKDSKGDIIYNEPGEGIPEYYEGTSKVVSVYVYPDTAFGPCTITILGELKEYNSNGVKVPIPTNWEGTYNLRWQKQINVNPFVANTTKIRFYRRPKVTIEETILPIFNRTVNRITVSGSVSGVSINPPSNSNFTNFNGDTIYELRATGSVFSSSMEGEIITVNGLSQSYSIIVKDVVNSKKILATIPYYETASVSGSPVQTVKDFTNANFTLPYNNSITLENSSISSSFAKIKLTDLETFSGDVNRLKIYASRKADIGNYTLLEDIQLESNEILLTDVHSGSVSVRTGQFGNQSLINDFWKYKHYDVNIFYTAPLNNVVLASSVRLTDDSTENTTQYPQRIFYYSSSIDFIKNTEYQLDFSTTLLSSSFASGKIQIYGSGSAFLNTDSNIPLGKLLGELDAGTSGRVFGKQQINFKSDDTSTGTIVFAVYQGDWYLSNLSLRASQETNFSPNQLTLNVAVPTIVNNDAYDFKFEFYDINNNYVPVTLNKEFTFVGADNATIIKTLSVVPDGNFLTFSGSGQVIGANSINFEISKVGLTGSVLFASSAFDDNGDYINPSFYVGTGYPGGLTNLTQTSATLTAESFTGSVGNIKVTKLIYTASCEDVTDKVFIYRIDQGGTDGLDGVDAKILNAIATKNTFIFDPDDANKPAINNDFIDIKVSKNINDALNYTSSLTTPPLTFISAYSESNNLVTIYRLYAGSTLDNASSWSYNTPSISDHSSNYTFFAGQFTSSVTIEGALKGENSKNLNVTTNANQFFYKMTDLSDFPTGQVINVFAKRNNLGSVSSSIIITSGSGKPPLQIGSNNNTTGVQSYFISGSNYNFTSGSTTYTFTTTDLNSSTYNDTLTISPVIVESQIGVSISNENTSFPAYSTGTVLAGFGASSGSITVKVGTDTISYASIGTNRYTASFTSSAGLTQTTGFNGTDYSISALTVDSGSLTINVTYFDGRGSGSSFQKVATYSKAKSASPSVIVSANPLNQSIVGNATGSQSGSLKDVLFTALEGNTSRFVSMSITSGGFTTSPTYSPTVGTLTMSSAVIDRTKNEASASVIVYYTNSEGTAGSSSILISATKVNVGITGSNGTNGAAGAAGPGVVLRGEYVAGTTYYYTTFAGSSRRDVVYQNSGGITKYYATLQQTTGNSPTNGIDNAYWQYLGDQDFFVSAKIAIFDESYVKNTLNVGTNVSGSAANITLAGGTTNPYISVGQFTQGYGNDGIFLGRSSSNSKISFVSGSSYFKYDSGATNIIDIGGRLNATELLASSGSIGGFTIQGSKLRVGTPSVGLVLDGNSNKIVAGAESGSLSATLSLNGIHAGGNAYSTAPFRVSTNGDLYAASAIISGSINAGQGTIGGWTIGSNELYNGTVKLYASGSDSYIQVRGETTTSYAGNQVKIHPGALTGVGGSISSLNATNAQGSYVNVNNVDTLYLTNSSTTATVSTSNTALGTSLDTGASYSIVATIKFKIDVVYQSISTNAAYVSNLSSFTAQYAAGMYLNAAGTTNLGTSNSTYGWFGESGGWSDFVSLYNSSTSGTDYGSIYDMPDGTYLDIITAKSTTNGSVTVAARANYNSIQYGSNTSTFSPVTEDTTEELADITFNINATGAGTANIPFSLTKTNTLGTYYDVVRWQKGTYADFTYNGTFYGGGVGVFASSRTQTLYSPTSVTYSAKGVSLTANGLTKQVEITERGFQALFNSATDGSGNFFKIEDIASPTYSNANIKSAGKFSHYGELHVSGDIAGYSTALSSDERLKENIEKIGNDDIQKLYDLNAVEYNWKSDKDKNLHYGFIAQDVEKIYPHLTRTKMMGEYLTINYNELIPIMVKEIQNLRKELDSIKKDINNAE